MFQLGNAGLVVAQAAQILNGFKVHGDIAKVQNYLHAHLLV